MADPITISNMSLLNMIVDASNNVFDVSNNKIINLADPVNDNDAVNLHTFTDGLKQTNSRIENYKTLIDASFVVLKNDLAVTDASLERITTDLSTLKNTVEGSSDVLSTLESITNLIEGWDSSNNNIIDVLDGLVTKDKLLQNSTGSTIVINPLDALYVADCCCLLPVPKQLINKAKISGGYFKTGLNVLLNGQTPQRGSLYDKVNYYYVPKTERLINTPSFMSSLVHILNPAMLPFFAIYTQRYDAQGNNINKFKSNSSERNWYDSKYVFDFNSSNNPSVSGDTVYQLYADLQSGISNKISDIDELVDLGVPRIKLTLNTSASMINSATLGTGEKIVILYFTFHTSSNVSNETTGYEFILSNVITQFNNNSLINYQLDSSILSYKSLSDDMSGINTSLTSLLNFLYSTTSGQFTSDKVVKGISLK